MDRLTFLAIAPMTTLFLACSSAHFSGSNGRITGNAALPPQPATDPAPEAAAPAAARPTDPALASISGSVVTRETKEASDVPLSDAFKDHYTVVELGTPVGVPPPFGCVTALPGDPDALIVGGRANNADGAFYRVKVKRDAFGHVVAFDGAAELFMSAPFNDGGCVFLDDSHLLMTRWPTHSLALLDTDAKVIVDDIDLHPLIKTAGFPANESVAALALIPDGLNGAGRLMLTSWPSSRFFHANLLAGSTLQVDDVKEVAPLTGNGPEGFVYVPANSPGVTGPSMLVSEYTRGAVALYATDEDGAPLPATRQEILSLPRAEGAFLEARTGDYFFSTFNGGAPDKLYSLRGFSASVPELTAFAGSAFVDENGNGQLDDGEPTAPVENNGSFRLGGLAPGPKSLRLDISSGHHVVEPGSASIEMDLVEGQALVGQSFTVE